MCLMIQRIKTKKYIVSVPCIVTQRFSAMDEKEARKFAYQRLHIFSSGENGGNFVTPLGIEIEEDKVEESK